jgi:hypothetical protein
MSGAESVAIFALACNVLQVTELGARAVSIGRTIYKTGSSDPEGDVVNQQLHSILQDLEVHLRTIDQKPTPTHDEKQLSKISKDSLTTAERLREILEQPAAAQGSKRASLKWGCRRVFKKGDIDKLEMLLQKQKAALDTGLLLRIW